MGFDIALGILSCLKVMENYFEKGTTMECRGKKSALNHAMVVLAKFLELSVPIILLWDTPR